MTFSKANVPEIDKQSIKRYSRYLNNLGLIFIGCYRLGSPNVLKSSTRIIV